VRQIQAESGLGSPTVSAKREVADQVAGASLSDALAFLPTRHPSIYDLFLEPPGLFGQAARFTSQVWIAALQMSRTKGASGALSPKT
jgi:hypothetical protein